jgi:hypothetical protein
MDTKHIHHIYPHASFPCAYPPPTGTHPQNRFIFPSCPSFLLIKCILIAQEGCALVLQVCIYEAFIKLTPLLPYLLILYHHASLIFLGLVDKKRQI